MGGVIVGLVVQELICTAAGGLSKILYILSHICARPTSEQPPPVGLHGALSLSPAYRLYAGRQTVSNVHV